MTTERFDVIAQMSAGEARSAVIIINQHLRSARALLLELYERRGWVALGYTSWRECAIAEFGEQEREVYRTLQAAQIEQNVQGVLTNLSKPLPESQLRPLAALPAPAQRLALKQAHTRARDAGERMAARHVQEAVDDYHEQKTEDMTDRPTRFTSGMRSSDSDAWFTPERILTPVRAILGAIDLDPCSTEEAQRNVGARHYYTEADDGLSQPWGPSESIYMNPPYGRTIGLWTDRLIRAYHSGEVEQALALLPGRTDTDWFTPLFAYPICFVHGRLTFSGYTAGAPFPSVVVYFGAEARRFARVFEPLGAIMMPYTTHGGYNANEIRTPDYATRTRVTA